jgi:hypothetical protein
MPDGLPPLTPPEAVRLIQTVSRHCAEMAEEFVLAGAVLAAERIHLERALATLQEELDE